MRHQFFMGSSFYRFSMFHDDDIVRILYRRQPVRDHQCGPPFRKFSQSLQHIGLRLHIQR